MDDEASDDNDWLCDDFEEDDDKDCDNGNDEIDKEKFKSSCEVVKYSPERNDGHSHIHTAEEETLPFDPSQDVVDRHKQDEKHKDEMKEKKDDSEGSVYEIRPPVDTAFHQTSASTNSSGITGVSGQSNKNIDNLSDRISCLESESLQQQSPSIENSDHAIGVNIRYSPSSELLLDESPNGSRTPDKAVPGQGKDVTVVQTQSQIPAHKIEETTEHHRQSYVQIPFEGTVERRFSNSVLQPGAQSCHPHNSGESSNYSSGTTINLVRNKGVNINQVSGSFEPLKPIQEQSQLRLDSDLNKKLFVKTQKIEECEEALTKRGVLLLTGGPGEGKTTAGLHLLKLMSDHWRPLILTDPQDWNNLSGPTPENNRYVILIDDAFGRTNLMEDLKTRWEQKFPMMLPMIEAGTVCVIFSFRTNIYLQYEKQFRTFELFRRCKTVNLSTDNLSEKERLAMFDVHLKLYNKNAFISDDEKMKIIKCRDLVSFPLCCYLFSSTLRDEHGCIFFHRSLKYIAEVIRSMRQNDPESFFVLLLVMFYDNLLPKTVFDVFAQSSEDQEIIAKLSQVCSVRPSLGSLLNSAKSLCQTFLIFDTQNNYFSFMHNSIQDAVFLEFCKDHLSKGLEMCSTRTLLEYVTTDQRSCQDVTVIVFESQFEGLASRLVREILSPSVSLIFTHQAFKNLSFVRYLFLFLNADTRNELAVYNREIQSCGVHQYLTDTTITFLMNKCLNEPTEQHLFHSHYVNVLSIDSIPACFVLNGADRIAIHLLKCMQQNGELFSCHANKALACSFYMNNRDLANELTELGAEITFDCFKAVCIAPSINENLVELAAGIISEEHADSLCNLLTLSLEKGNCECINQIILFMARSGRYLQLGQFCKCLLITCHNTRPSWISVPLEQRKFVEIFDLLQSHEVNCSSDLYVLLAAGCHDVQILKYFVKCRGNVHCRNETGQSPLHLAALYGSGDTVMYLLEQDVEKHARDNDGYTALHRAAQSSTESYDKVVLLADENAQLTLNSGESVLDISIRKGDIETVEYLCSQFSDRGQLGQPLFVAVSELAQTLSSRERCPENVFQRKWTENRYHIVQMLIKAGFSMPDLNDIMLSSLNVLAERGKKDIFDAIIGSFDMTTCDVTTLFYLIKTAIHSSQSLLYDQLYCLIQSRPIVKDTESKTLLHYACQRRETDIVEYLVKIEYQVNVTDDIDKTPLHYAVECEHGDTFMVECLIKGGATVNVKDRYGKTPVYLACERGDIAIVECLIEGGAEVNGKYNYEDTLLHHATERADTGLVECLIKGGAKVNVKNIFGRTPLLNACQHGGTALVERLVQRGAEVNVQANNWTTPIHDACTIGDTAMVECLILAGAEVNVKNRYGETPLHYACKHGDTVMVECLMKGGADLDVKNSDGKTPLQHVLKQRNNDTVQCLVRRDAV